MSSSLSQKNLPASASALVGQAISWVLHVLQVAPNIGPLLARQWMPPLQMPPIGLAASMRPEHTGHVFKGSGSSIIMADWERSRLTLSSSATEAGEDRLNHGTDPAASLCSLERVVRHRRVTCAMTWASLTA